MKYTILALILLFSCSKENISPKTDDLEGNITVYYKLGISSAIYGYKRVECDSLLNLGSLVKYDEHYYIVTEN